MHSDETPSDSSVPATIAEDAPVPDSKAVPQAADETATVVWHREHLRTADQPALVHAAAHSDRILPLFIFDPAFYGTRGLACDSRIALLHDHLNSLDRQYRARSETGQGLTFAWGDPDTVLGAFADQGWSISTVRTPTGRYGRRRDERVSADHDVAFVDEGGLVWDAETPREDWQTQLMEWLEAPLDTWTADAVAIDSVDTGVTPEQIADRVDLSPTKTEIPDGGRRAAVKRLSSFADDITAYPANISSPAAARDGCSGLSPYLTFGVLSVREVYQYIHEHAPDCRGREWFTSRLVWNRHYNQKLADWPGWTDKAVNPVFRGWNAEQHDPALVEAWKQGQTGYPMVDASMRCLAATGWLNFRMRAMCASFFAHILAQPWRIGADWYHHHLLDSDAGINYTQWQSQAGLIGRPSLRLYNPRKQVRDNDPDGEFIRRWVPELRTLPTTFLDQPEKTPTAVQNECSIEIGDEYPYPVVDFETRRTAFWERYDRVSSVAAARLAEPATAKRASLSGGIEAANAIAARHGDDTDEQQPTQVQLDDLTNVVDRGTPHEDDVD